MQKKSVLLVKMHLLLKLTVPNLQTRDIAAMEIFGSVEGA